MARKKKTAPKSLRESLGFEEPQSRIEALLIQWATPASTEEEDNA